MFDLRIVSPQRLIYDEPADHVFLSGDDSEYELLSYHAHLMGVLGPGNIVIDNKKAVPVQSGIVRFYENTCTILVEEPPKEEAPKKIAS